MSEKRPTPRLREQDLVRDVRLNPDDWAKLRATREWSERAKGDGRRLPAAWRGSRISHLEGPVVGEMARGWEGSLTPPTVVDRPPAAPVAGRPAADPGPRALWQGEPPKA